MPWAGDRGHGAEEQGSPRTPYTTPSSSMQGAMYNSPEEAVPNPMAEVALEGGSGDDKEGIEEVVDLCTCRPKPSGDNWSGRSASSTPITSAIVESIRRSFREF